MASKKRKSPDVSTARHRDLKTAEGKSVRDRKDHASKKLKTSHQPTSQHGPKVTKAPKVEEETKEPLLNKTSVLREEEPLFPRGGGSVLTPLEHRQINVEAKRDVLFEQTGKSKARIGGEGRGGDHVVVEQTKSASKRRGKQETINERLVPKPAHRDVGPRIESLSFNVSYHPKKQDLFHMVGNNGSLAHCTWHTGPRSSLTDHSGRRGAGIAEQSHWLRSTHCHL